MQIAIGCDALGFELKNAICDHLKLRYDLHDYGVNSAGQDTPYYEIAAKVAKQISHRKVQRAILICGTGMGMAIIANKFRGVYASVCENAQAAKYSRSINNSNILTLGQLITSTETAFEIIDTWLETEFTSGWNESVQKFLHDSVSKIQHIEKTSAKRNKSRKKT